MRTPRAMAVVTSGQMIQAHALRFRAHPDWQMQITDEQGAVVCHLRFGGTAEA